jgi:hypothetical protein
MKFLLRCHCQGGYIQRYTDTANPDKYVRLSSSNTMLEIKQLKYLIYKLITKSFTFCGTSSL